jgi:predicted nucleic acid-binding protein
MRLLVDSSVLIDHLRGYASATDLLLRLVRAGEELWSVTPVRTEIIAGMRPGEEAATRALLDQLRWLDVDVDLADHAGETAGGYVRTHPGVDAIDYLLAAGAERVRASPLTTNVRHFPMIEGLKPAHE